MWSLVFHEPGSRVDTAARPCSRPWYRVTAWLAELKKVCKRPSCKTASPGSTDQAGREGLMSPRSHDGSLLLDSKPTDVASNLPQSWLSSSCCARVCARSLILQHLVRRAGTF